MTLYGIDVSSNQPAGICSMVDYDFAIVKATGNPRGYSQWYVNPYYEQQVQEAYDRCGCVGLYHFTYGGDAAEEADFFCDTVSAWVGSAMLVIDYEGDGALSRGREWLRALIGRVRDNTGVNPVVYASSSVIEEQELEALCSEEDCSLWSANYWRGYDTVYGYDTDGMRQDVPSSALWQFTSQGRLDGYDGYLDLDVFYGDAGTWGKYCRANKEEEEEDMLTEHQDKLLATIYEQQVGTYDPTGRGIELNDHDHIKWIGKYVNDIQAKLEEQDAKIDKILAKIKCGCAD
jgi:lysozyme